MGGMVTMFAPDGTQGQIPQANVKAAIAAGAQPAAAVYAPDGTPGFVPANKLGDALHAGASTSKPAPLTDNPNGEGTYAMAGQNGTIQVPYSKVPGAMASGLQLSGDDNARYGKDAGWANNGVHKFVSALGNSLGLTGTPNTDIQDAKEHPILTALDLNGAYHAGQAAVQGVKRSAGEIGQAYQSAKAGNLGDAAMHTVAAVPVVGSAMADVATRPDVGNTGSYAGDVKSVVTNPAAMGTLVGASAQAAPIVAGAVDAAAAPDTAADVARSNPSPTPTPTPASPIEAAVNKNVAKIGIDAGTPATSPEEIAQAQENARNGLHQTLQDSATQAVKDAVPDATPTQPSSIRDVMGNAARAVYASAKDDYAALDQASGGRWQRFDDQIQNINDKIGDVTDDEDYDKWAQQLDKVEAARDKMVSDMVAEGKVDPAIADRATAAYKRSMALQEADKAVQMSTERVPSPDGSSMVNRINPDKLSPRLQKLNDIPINGGASRLEQALGADGAQGLVDSTDATRLAMQVPATDATGQAALSDLLKNNTTSNPGILNANATQVDWSGVLNDLDKMGDTAGQTFKGGDLQKVRNFVVKQVRAQKTGEFVKSVAKIGVKAGLYGGIPVSAYELYHNLTSQ